MASQLQLVCDWGDCDAAGIAFYPNFFRWFDSATWALFERIDLPMQTHEARFGGVGFPLAATSAQFLRPVRIRERLTVRTTVTNIAARRLALRHEVSGGGDVKAIGIEERFWAVRHNGEIRSAQIPEPIRTALADFLDVAA
jgi:4-hydroxybenzoyl-CoA thioesterase